MMKSGEVRRAKKIVSAAVPVHQKVVEVIASLRPQQNESNISNALNQKENIIMHEKIGRRIVDEAGPLLVEVVSEGIEQGVVFLRPRGRVGQDDIDTEPSPV